MKKIGLLLVIALMVIGTVFAQNQEKERRSPPEPITVEGTLQLEKGLIAVASGENVYFVGMLHRYAGFIDGIKEGNKVTIVGYAYKNFLRPTKLSIGGKSYDFPVMGPAQWQRRMDDARPGYGQGRYREGPKHGPAYRHAPYHRFGPPRRPGAGRNPAQRPAAPRQQPAAPSQQPSAPRQQR